MINVSENSKRAPSNIRRHGTMHCTWMKCPAAAALWGRRYTNLVHLSTAARSCHRSRLKASSWLYLIGLFGIRNNQPTTWLALSN